MLSIPDRMGKDISLKILLEERYGKGNIFTVHRLDKDTSGVIVFAKTAEAHATLSQMFEGRDVKKFYAGFVHGSPVNEEGSIDTPIMEHPGKETKMMTHAKGKASLTDYKVLEDFGIYSWMQFQIHTGRTHQIRVHMQHIGHSIVCDEIYGTSQPVFLSALKKKYNLSKNEIQERPLLSRLALHSHILIFDLDGQHYELEAEIPKDMRALLQQLRKVKK